MISHHYNITNDSWLEVIFEDHVVGYYKTIIDTQICPTSTTALVKIPPHSKFQHHEHDYIHVFYFSEGQGEVIVDNKAIPIAQGLVVVIEPYQHHEIINSSNNDLLFIAVKEENHHTDQKLPDIDF